MINDPGLANAVLYNPRQLNRETLKAIFTARRHLLDRLVQDLHAKRPNHHLLVGPRGMGKTTLLRRLGIAIEEDYKLAKRLLPLTFPEEQYNVGSLGEFYLNCLDALADYLDKHEDAAGAKKLDALVEALRKRPEAELVEETEAALVRQAKSMKRQFVLLVDNLSFVIDRLSDKEKWRLREWLSQSEQGPVLIAATVKFISDTADYGQALYEFLHVQELAGCDTEEAAAVLRELAKVFAKPQVLRWMEADPARLAVLNRLAGGAPRTLVMLFQLLVQGMDGPIFQELDSLLDMATPLYKARFEELPDQAQRVVDALALHWDPATRQDLEQESRIDGNAISSQLSRLAKMGWVEEVAIPGEAKTAYQIAERFFNIWYLMRASRRSRYQLRWLVEFLKAWYSQEELSLLSRALLGNDQSEPLYHAMRLAALYFAVEDASLKNELREAALYWVDKVDPSQRLKLDLSDLNAKPSVTLDKLHELSKKEKDILKRIKNEPLSTGGWFALGCYYQDETRELFKAEEAFRKAIELDRDNWWSARCWNKLGVLLSDDLGRFADAEQAYRKAIELDPLYPFPWNNLGNLLSEHMGRYSEARDAYCKALELDSMCAHYWSNLGNCYVRLKQYPEAEKALRRAVAISPSFPFGWNNLGNYETNHLNRYAEGEKAYRKAIDKSAEYANPKGGLAWNLYLQGRANNEAEELARAAIRLEPKPFFLRALACILARNGRITESVEWIRKYLGTPTSELNPLEISDPKFYFRELVHHNQTDLGVRLLEESDSGEAWRPLVEALRAAGKRDRGSLKRINPEQREAAEKIYAFFVSGLPEDQLEKPQRTRKSSSSK